MYFLFFFNGNYYNLLTILLFYASLKLDSQLFILTKITRFFYYFKNKIMFVVVLEQSHHL